MNTASFMESWRNRMSRFEHFVDRVTGKHSLIFVGVTALIYLVVTLQLARAKLFWTDEFFTLYLSRLGPGELWRALLTGGDQHPPSFYLIHHLFLSVSGEHDWILRLPEVLGFLLMIVCVYRFVAKRTAPVYGLLAMVVPLNTIAYEYSYEARGYSLLAGFLALTALCWQQAGERPRRFLAAAGIAIGLMAGVASHYYAILLLPALVVAEVVRSYRRKTFNVPVWIAFCASIIPLLLFIPLLRGAGGFATNFWAKLSVHEIDLFYSKVLGGSATCLVCGLVVAGLYQTILERKPIVMEQTNEFPVEEVILAAGFAVAPFVAYLMGRVFTGVFAWRYAFGGIIGLAILFGFFCFRLFRGSQVAALLFVLVTGGYFFANAQFGKKRQLDAARRGFYYLRHYLKSNAPDSAPLIIGDSDLFYMLTYYSPTARGSHYLYLADPKRSLKYLHHDTIERSLLALNPWFGLNVISYDSFFARNSTATVWSSIDRKWNWLASALVDKEREVIMVGRLNEGLLLSIREAPLRERITVPWRMTMPTDSARPLPP